MSDLGGITLVAKEPSEFVAKLVALVGGLHTVNPSAVAIAVASIVIIAGLRRWRPSWPGILIAVALAAVVSSLLSLPVETAANVLGRVAAKAHRQGIRLFITGASPAVRRALLTHGVTPPRARYRATIARAVADIKGGAALPAADGAAANQRHPRA